MAIRLEHANISVKDIDGMIRFLQTAFHSFRIRRDETEPDGRRWVHIGTDDAYIALNQATDVPAEDWTPYGGKPGVNHLGFAVDDAEAVRWFRLAADVDHDRPSHPTPAGGGRGNRLQTG